MGVHFPECFKKIPLKIFQNIPKKFLELLQYCPSTTIKISTKYIRPKFFQKFVQIFFQNPYAIF